MGLVLNLLIRPGNYHEEMTIKGKDNFAIRGDLDYGRPIIDGSVVLQLKSSSHHGPKNSENKGWTERYLVFNTKIPDI